jgi:hypothetical protein
MKTKARVRRVSRVAKPSFAFAAHTLHVRGWPVKHFKRFAPVQEAVLTAFQDAGWPPFLPTEPIHLPRGNGKARLRDAVRNLNRSVSPHLHFRLEGSGGRICWERG